MDSFPHDDFRYTPFKRSDPRLQSLRELAMGSARWQLAEDSRYMVTFLSQKLSHMIPDMVAEARATGRAWGRYIDAKGTRRDVKDAIHTLSLITRSDWAGREIRLICTALKHFLAIAEGESNWLEGMMLYLSWRREQLKTECNGEYERLIRVEKEISDIEAHLKETLRMEEAGHPYPEALVKDTWNVEYVHEEKAPREEGLKKAPARRALQKEKDRDFLSASARERYLSGRSRATHIEKSRLPILMNEIKELDDFQLKCFSAGAAHLTMLKLEKIDGSHDETLRLVYGRWCGWMNGKCTKASLRRMFPPILLRLKKEDRIEEMYLFESLMNSLLSAGGEDTIKRAVDSFFSPYMHSSEKLERAVVLCCDLIDKAHGGMLPDPFRYIRIES